MAGGLNISGMIIDLNDLAPNQVYFHLIQALIPRPIAWVLSENEQKSYNLAPFSYFTAVSSDPPLIMISVGKKPDASIKDTRANIEQRNDFVVHIAHRELLDALNASSATLPAGVSEVDRLALRTTDFTGCRLPRLADSRLALACERYRIQEIGNDAQALVFGKVKALYADDDIVTGGDGKRLKILADRLDPIARLGAGEYAFLSEIVYLKRPK